MREWLPSHRANYLPLNRNPVFPLPARSPAPCRFWCRYVAGLLLVLCGPAPTVAQADDYLVQLHCLGVEDGLSSRSVYGFLLDQRDVLWVATSGGLDSYDGTQLTHHEVGTGSVNLLFEGAAGHIWTVGYPNALIRGKPSALPARIRCYTPATGALRDLAALGAPPALLDGVTRMSARPDAAAYFAARDGSIWRYRETFERLTPPAAPVRWLAHTAEGIAYLQGEQLRLLEYGTDRIRQLRTVDVSHALGLGLLGPDRLYITELLPPYTTESSYQTTVSDLRGRPAHRYQQRIARAPFCLPEDPAGFYYSAVDTMKYHRWADATTQRVSFGSADPGRARELFKRVHHVDRYGRLYAPIIDGFCTARLQLSPFESFLADTVPSRSIRLIAPQTPTRAYVGTSYGLFYLAPDTVRQLSTGEFPTVHLRRPGSEHYFGYHGPIVRRLYAATPFRMAHTKYLSETSISLIAALAPLDDQTLRLGTDRGSFRLRTRDLRMWPDTLLEADGRPVESGATVYQYYRSPVDGGVWIVSDRGIFEQIGPTRWRHLPALGTHWYNHVHQDTAGVYWLGTRTEGLLRYDPRTATLTTYGVAEGLVDPCIYAVYEDERGELWLPSNRGLMCVDKDLERVRVYRPEQGLPHEEFNWGAHARDTAGHLYFGGLNGYVRFHPDTVRHWQRLRQELLVPRWKSVQRIRRRDGHADSLLTEAESGRALRYFPEESFVQFSITRPNFTRTDADYAYRVVGQTDWLPIVTGTPVELGYFGYGTQTVEVVERARPEVVLLRLALYLPRPLHARWWFVPALLLLAMLFGYLVFYYRLQRGEQRRRALRAEIDRQTEDLRRLNQFKDRFFSILSHDLRSPLLGLRGLSKKARYLVDRERYEELHALGAEVDRSTEAVQRLIGNVFDWAQLQRGEYHLQPVCVDAERLLEELRLIYQPLADQREVRLNFILEKDISPVVDLDALRTILRNLLDNALKNSPVGGEVDVTVGGDADENWYLSVADEGPGMPPPAQRILTADVPPDTSTRTLGLRLVWELVDRQGGRIRVSVAGGTEVRVDFSAADA